MRGHLDDKLIRNKMVVIKVNEYEYQELKFRAEAFAKGNMSLWLRQAGLRFKPKFAKDGGNEQQRN